MAVITISRQFGSGGDEIAEQVGQILQYRIFDKEIIARATLESGISDQEVMDYSEANYKVKGFFDRLFGLSRSVGKVRVWKEDTQGVRTTEAVPLTEENALALVQKAIKAACEEGNIIVVGRGGQVLLQDCPNVLHVRIEAPLEDRLQRVRAQFKLKRRPASEMIEARDEASAEYVRTFYKVNWSDPTLYHMVINTGKLGLEASARLIAEAVRLLNPVQADW